MLMAKIDRMAHAQMLADHDAMFVGVVAGIDEVGRGPLAGNVVTACVVMPKEPLLPWVDDSKKLSEARREKVFQEIMDIALYVGIGQATPEEIDEINILEATKKAMREAAAQVPADVFLIDAVTGLGLNGREVPIIKGDATSYAIAAASIVAKVTRDRQLIELDKQYPEYGFARNKGYGTAEHIAALKTLGPCPAHRRSFIRNFCHDETV
jgi:ribonuclease HII